MRLPAAALGIALVTAGPATSQLLPTEFPDGAIEVNYQSVGFSTSDIIEVEDFELDGLFWVQIRLAPRLDAEVGALTREKLGHQVWVTLCGQRVIEAQIQEEFTTATFVVTTGDGLEAQQIADLFRSPPCAVQS